MTLYHNADFSNLENILKNGLLCSDIVGNSWEMGKRSDNPTNVVYLHESVSKFNSFTQYGLALIEVDVATATATSFAINDNNGRDYNEYVTKSVSPVDIIRVYIPLLLKERFEEEFAVYSDLIEFVEIDGFFYNGKQMIDISSVVYNKKERV